MYGVLQPVAIPLPSAKISPSHPPMAFQTFHICQHQRACHKQDVHELGRFRLASPLEECVTGLLLCHHLLLKPHDPHHHQALLRARLQIWATSMNKPLPAMQLFYLDYVLVQCRKEVNIQAQLGHLVHLCSPQTGRRVVSAHQP